MNTKLLSLINKMFGQVLKGKFYEAIETNAKITKILNTYKESC